MSNFKFGQKVAASKDFYKKRQVTEILKIKVKNFVLSDEVFCNNRWLYCRLSSCWRNDHTISYQDNKGDI